MDMDKIIEKMRENRTDKIRESQFCTRGGYGRHDMEVLADGYSLAVKDLTDMVEKEKEEQVKLSEFCETLNNFNKAIDKKNKRLDNCFIYDINIGDEVKLKDGTIGKVNYAGRLHKHDIYEWYFVIAIEKGKTICLYSYDLSKDFQQIGKYNFYSEQKQSKIDKLKLETNYIIGHDFIPCGSSKQFVMPVKNGRDYTETTPPTNEQLMDKINEIIDVINKYKER